MIACVFCDRPGDLERPFATHKLLYRCYFCHHVFCWRCAPAHFGEWKGDDPA